MNKLDRRLIYVSLLFVFQTYCIANDSTLNRIFPECEKTAPHGTQVTACLFGGGGLMFVGVSILSYLIDPDDSSLFLLSLGTGIFGTTLTGLSIGFQIGAHKNWTEYRKCINENMKNTKSLGINVKIQI